MSTKLTRAEILNMRNEAFCTHASAVLASLRLNISHRNATLADHDLVLLADTESALNYLRTRVFREPNILLTDEMDAYIQYLGSYNEQIKLQKSIRERSENLNLLPIVDTEVLFGRTENMVHLSMAFNPRDYDAKESLMGSLASFFNKMGGVQIQPKLTSDAV